jgi:hypothetical protein
LFKRNSLNQVSNRRSNPLQALRRPSVKTIKKAVTAIRKMTGMGRKKRGGFIGDFFKTLSNPSSWDSKISNEILNPNSVSKQLLKVAGFGRKRKGRGVTTMPYYG